MCQCIFSMEAITGLQPMQYHLSIQHWHENTTCTVIYIFLKIHLKGYGSNSQDFTIQESRTASWLIFLHQYPVSVCRHGYYSTKLHIKYVTRGILFYFKNIVLTKAATEYNSLKLEDWITSKYVNLKRKWTLLQTVFKNYLSFTTKA